MSFMTRIPIIKLVIYLKIFFNECANITWGTKGAKGPPFLVLRTFYKQRVLVVLQHA
jgi:hypothetical protein